ncbi:MAG: tetraacyldisaccharide 4'-kinase [Thiotrichales bacterium]|jgi:tetraacyldisaccharide 4'-kinase|nr:tetraacyldisaccharide 4'-kinase [Thiotrichales bacterium]
MLSNQSFINHNKFGLVNFILLPFSAVFFILSYIRLWLYRFRILKVNDSSLPVIVVGNITVGGTGKTPIVISIVNYLKSQNKKVGVVSRGYGGEYPQESLEVTLSSDPIECGDEPLLIKQQTKVPVAVAKNRTKAIEFLIKKYSLDVIVSDDGLQHYSMGRDIEIAVIDGHSRLGNGLLLPAGPLREAKSRLKSVDFIINNGSNLEGEISSEIEPHEYINLLTKEVKGLDHFKDKKCYAVAGIGKPDNFFSILKNNGVKLITKPFPDHYVFTEKDLIFNENHPIIMTSKDCVKCTQFATNQMWYLSVSAKINSNFYQQLESKF